MTGSGGLIRPEVRALVRRWREVILALLFMGFGLWIFFRPGLFFGTLGGVIMGLGAGLALSAWRRLRFAQPPTGAGVVEVDEGQIGYFGPEVGGLIARPELQRIEIRALDGGRAWHLVPSQGAALTIPVDAQGSGALFDVIVALPGADPEVFLTALRAPPPSKPKVLWRRA